MKRKEIVIIVPGALETSYYHGWIIIFFKHILQFFGVVYPVHRHRDVWKNKIHSKDGIVYWMPWNGWVDLVSIAIAKKRLRKLIKEQQNKKISIVAVSLGTKIVLDVIKNMENENIKKIVLVCGVNDYRKSNFKHQKIINIYSMEDSFSGLAISIYAPFSGGKKLVGKNIKNVIVPGMTHDDFSSNEKIKSGKFKGRTITQLINYFLNE